MKDEQRQKAIKLYKNKNLKISEIAILVGLSTATLSLVLRIAFQNGQLTPRHQHSALKPRTPNGQGKKYVYKNGSGNYPHKSKYTAEQEIEIMQDYYENGFSIAKLKEKWNIFPVQLQRLRIKFREKYGIKPNAPYTYQNKYKNKEGILGNGECAEQDSERNAGRD